MGLFIKEKLKTQLCMEKANFCIEMFTVIVGNGKMALRLDTDNKIIISKVYIKGPSKKVEKLEKVFTLGMREEANIVEIFKMD
jgi:hypothetical protein